TLLSPRPPPLPTLFPYTTLFRSGEQFSLLDDLGVYVVREQSLYGRIVQRAFDDRRPLAAPLGPSEEEDLLIDQIIDPLERRAVRSEEHTSELQSRENLVCRLLLE